MVEKDGIGEENEKMGDVLEQYKRRREAKEKDTKKRLDEIEKAKVALKQQQQQQQQPMETRKHKVQVERDERREQQRDIVTGKPPRFQAKRDAKRDAKKTTAMDQKAAKMMKLKEKMKANLSQMDEDIKKMKEKQQTSKKEEFAPTRCVI